MCILHGPLKSNEPLREFSIIFWSFQQMKASDNGRHHGMESMDLFSKLNDSIDYNNEISVDVIAIEN